MVKHIIWDFDGVICDSKSIAFETHNELCKEFKNLPIIKNEEEYSSFINKDFDKSLSKYLSSTETNEYLLRHRQLMYSKRKQMKVFNDILDNIKELTIPSSIITATFEKLIVDVLKNNNYDEKMFKMIMGRETEGKKKDKILKLCEKFKISKNDIIYVGDTLSDIDFCKSLDIPIISVGYGYCSIESLKKNNKFKVCITQKELIEYIKDINNTK